ncbi:hypothetical protein [Clostridium cellulovorans]|uniref:rRNA biogenesis protein rrp5 n=1 Tax=Clostridium cellulovorans (strain ATCC 35296 / DSM 3052 / OCM 3 / 743B) TaxID=573061 RepID=D9SSD1_CLOC7|nr:hypothetical protein [Clostridium cellulovorans]ADL50528.1 hypothetical protein Clocel_0758 [Clostridium cellulovorans 743B]
MDIKLEVKVIAPELIEALLELAKALPHKEAILPVKEETTVEPKEAEVKVESKKDEETKEDTKKISLEYVRGRLAELSRDGKQVQVKELIKKFGANKLTEIPEEKYLELLKEAEEI